MSDKLSPSVLAAYLRSVSQTHLRVSELHRLNEVIETLESVDRLTAEVEAVRKDAALWNEYLPWMRQLNRKPFNLAKVILAIDKAVEASK